MEVIALFSIGEVNNTLCGEKMLNSAITLVCDEVEAERLHIKCSYLAMLLRDMF